MNSPLPDPITMSSDERIAAINKARELMLNGTELDVDYLRWAMTLTQINRAEEAKSRRSSTSKAKPATLPLTNNISVEDL